MMPRLPHFYDLPDPMVWVSKSIKTVGDITRKGELLTFDQRKARHDLPNTYYFRYFQLRHASQVQFCDIGIETQPSALQNILSEEDLTKTLSVGLQGAV